MKQYTSVKVCDLKRRQPRSPEATAPGVSTPSKDAGSEEIVYEIQTHIRHCIEAERVIRPTVLDCGEESHARFARQAGPVWMPYHAVPCSLAAAHSEVGMNWQVYALKYADRNSRTRSDSFIFDDNHDAAHPMDYFIWLLQCGDQTILVDTGYDALEAQQRDRPILREPSAALAEVGVQAADITTVIVTHLHYDHAGGLRQFPNASLHLQEAEMVYATGPCMCHEPLRMPYTAGHISDAVACVHSGRVVFHDGDGEVADGVTVHRIGGHSRGLQAVRVRTSAGWLCLASDASHFYENVFSGKPFPIVVDIEDMLAGFDRLTRLASDRSLIIPGHDPQVLDLFDTVGPDFCVRLDTGPRRPFPW